HFDLDRNNRLGVTPVAAYLISLIGRSCRGSFKSPYDRRELGPLRRMANRCRLLSGRDVRLGVRLLWTKRLSRRTAPAARLAGLADFDRDDFFLSVRRAACHLRCRDDPKVR